MSETLYDAEIGPALLRIANLCREHGMSMVCEVEFEPGQGALTAAIEPGASTTIQLVHEAAKSRGNVDALFTAVADLGRNDRGLRVKGVENIANNLDAVAERHRHIAMIFRAVFVERNVMPCVDGTIYDG